ncbi:MAG: hypothetical protein EA384_01645 [Spirochaetaceae bacterium]|nr:MAG: hypothetical protein EA384_01645 [Spirochaetaceae bacterium]
MRRPNGYIRLLVVLNLAMIAICIRHYAEPYDLRAYPISSLGGTETMNGYPNRSSALRFVAGMAASSSISFRYGTAYHAAGLPLASTVRTISRLASAGFLVTALPHNIPALWRPHGIGAAAVFVGFWAITLLQLRSLAERFGPVLQAALGALLTVPLASYALLIAAGSPLEHAAQKFAVLGLVLTTLRVSHEMELQSLPATAGEPRWA